MRERFVVFFFSWLRVKCVYWRCYSLLWKTRSCLLRNCARRRRHRTFFYIYISIYLCLRRVDDPMCIKFAVSLVWLSLCWLFSGVSSYENVFSGPLLSDPFPPWTIVHICPRTVFFFLSCHVIYFFKNYTECSLPRLSSLPSYDDCYYYSSVFWMVFFSFYSEDLRSRAHFWKIIFRLFSFISYGLHLVADTGWIVNYVFCSILFLEFKV